jgi:predicted ester cyclase
LLYPETECVLRGGREMARFADVSAPHAEKPAGEPSQDALGVYRRFLDALNARNLDRTEHAVDPDRWREVCVGFTNGPIRWPDSRTSMEKVWAGIPDLQFEPEHLVSDGEHVVAVGTVRGRQTGRLFGAPATKRSYEASMFDYVRVEDGRIVDRVQQADMLGQFKQLFAPMLITAAAVTVLLVLAIGILIGILI